MSLFDRIGIDVGRKLVLEDAVEWAAEHRVRYIDIQLDTGDNALPTISGVTVTVFVDRLTMLDAASSKSSASQEACLEVTVKLFEGSRSKVSETWPKAWPPAPTGANATPFTLPSSYTIWADV